MKRKWLVVLLVLGLVGLAVLVTLSLWLGSVIKTNIERLVPPMTKTTIRLQAVNLSLLTGCATIKGLVIGNPSGFHAPSSFSVETVRACVAPLSLFLNPLVVTEVSVESPDVTVEGVFSGNSNLNRIRDNVQAYAATGKRAKAAAAQAADAAGSRRILVKEFRLTNGRVSLWVSGGALGEQRAAIGLPDVHLRDIGKETNGARPEELSAAITTAVHHAVTRAIAEAARPLGKAAESLRESVEKAGEEAGKAASKLLEGFQ
ncbi:MAG: hypothetical protein AB1411_03790 [Nitrospirota bacterium]